MSTPATPPLPEIPTPPTVTYYQQLADQVFAELDAIANTFPRVEARRIWTVDFFRSHLNVPTDFLATVIAPSSRFRSCRPSADSTSTPPATPSSSSKPSAPSSTGSTRWPGPSNTR